MNILLLEDDPLLCDTLIDLLTLHGYDVDLASDGEGALDKSFEKRYDLYLFDVNVPSLNGFDLLKSLRDSGDETPAIFITALVDISSLSKGFKAGADDYIKKPFDPDELLVRIGAKLSALEELRANGEISYDLKTNTITKSGKTVDLGDVRASIFRLLITHKGQTVDKTQFYDVMENPSDTALRVHMTNLKKTLGVEITNVRGVGYRLEKA